MKKPPETIIFELLTHLTTDDSDDSLRHLSSRLGEPLNLSGLDIMQYLYKEGFVDFKDGRALLTPSGFERAYQGIDPSHARLLQLLRSLKQCNGQHAKTIFAHFQQRAHYEKFHVNGACGAVMGKMIEKGYALSDPVDDRIFFSQKGESKMLELELSLDKFCISQLILTASKPTPLVVNSAANLFAKERVFAFLPLADPGAMRTKLVVTSKENPSPDAAMVLPIPYDKHAGGRCDVLISGNADFITVIGHALAMTMAGYDIYLPEHRGGAARSSGDWEDATRNFFAFELYDPSDPPRSIPVLTAQESFALAGIR